eukprot:Tbor_TRINITY_DN2611_c0_g1::TRINITY_DN2611_c0_g1_i1::g.17899::m.17899/K00938/E2.7.4.2, mvaK2; phosphomevalonate kinase
MSVVSAPGKVLICGGYLLVESPNLGLSVSVTARFTSRITNIIQSDVCLEGSNKILIHINSPQFKTHFVFEVTYGDGEVAVVQSEGCDFPFMYYSILYAVAGALDTNPSIVKSITGFTIDLLASNDFYSQRNYLEQLGKAVTTVNLRALPEACPLVGKVSKSGLGSSAAMTASVVAAILNMYDSASETERIHRIAQIAHSVSQGKIGSGFDVYTAIYGTVIYRRFPPARASMMMAIEQPKTTNVRLLSQCIDLSEEWVQTTPFDGLPKGIHIILADVHKGGSGTPDMVAKVMAWKSGLAKDSQSLWSRLGEANVDYVTLLQRMVENSKHSHAEWEKSIEQVAGVPSAQWPPDNVFYQAKEKAHTCRRLMREMGEASGVEIEPQSLRPLLDATAALPSVMATGCPGAGGFDAIFALVVGHEDSVDSVVKFWEEYKEVTVCPLLVREDSQGIKFE